MQTQMDIANAPAPGLTSPSMPPALPPAPAPAPATATDAAPSAYLQVEGMVTAEVLTDDEEYQEVGNGC